MTSIKLSAAQDGEVANLANALSASLRQQVIAALNVKPPEPSFYVRFLEKVAPSEASAVRSQLEVWLRRNTNQGALFVRNYLANAPYIQPPSTQESRWRWPRETSREYKQIITTALVSSHLRILVDEWLDTGRNDEGESPGRRSIQMAFKANSAVDKFVRKYPPRFLLGDYSGFTYRREGNLEAGNVFEAQNVEATRLFVNLIISDWKTRLCKCRYSYCGKYFLLEKSRSVYRHGTFCSREHRRDASARALTTERRSVAKASLIKSAAQWLAEPGRRSLQHWQSDRALKDRLAKHLSKQMKKKPTLRTRRADVKAHWVTRHCDEIARELTKLQRNPR